MRNNLAVAWGSVAKRTLVQDALTSIVAPGFAGSRQSAVRPTGMQTVYFTPIKLVKFVEYLACVMLVLWLVDRWIHNASIADVGWCAGLVGAAAAAGTGRGATGRSRSTGWLRCFLVWGIRVAS